KSASVTLPSGPSKTYSFSILTHGSLRRCNFNASCNFMNFFSFARSRLRAASHCFCETTLRFSTPWTVLIFGINVFSVGCSCCDLFVQFPQMHPPAAFIIVRHALLARWQRIPAGVNQCQPRPLAFFRQRDSHQDFNFDVFGLKAVN